MYISACKSQIHLNQRKLTHLNQRKLTHLNQRKLTQENHANLSIVIQFPQAPVQRQFGVG